LRITRLNTLPACAPVNASRAALRLVTRMTRVEEALTHTDLARFAQPVLVNGAVGIVVAPGGRLRIVIRCTMKQGKITEMDVIADPAHLRKLNLAVIPE
jgi:hypothetical protein